MKKLKREKRIYIRVNEEELKLFEKLKEKKNFKSISELVRYLVRRESEKN